MLTFMGRIWTSSSEYTDSDSYNDDLPHWVETGGKKHLVIPYSLDTNDVHFKLPSGFSGATQFYEYVCDSIKQLLKLLLV